MRTIPEVVEAVLNILNEAERREECNGDILCDINELMGEILTINSNNKPNTPTQEQVEEIRQLVIELEHNSIKSQLVTNLERASYQVTEGNIPIEVIRKDKTMEIINELLN